MIDFKEELKKYKPALEAEDLENDINIGEAHDIMKLLQYVVKKTGAGTAKEVSLMENIKNFARDANKEYDVADKEQIHNEMP